jgi:hypothetical protein
VGTAHLNEHLRRKEVSAINTEVIKLFPRWWKFYGKRFPGLTAETVMARMIARAATVHNPEEYFAEVCQNMWAAIQPGRKAPAGDYSGPADE